VKLFASKQSFVRGGGYFPLTCRGLYNVTGHGFDGTGQTLGFTLWTVPERQSAMTVYSSADQQRVDQPITVDPSCVATGTRPTTAELLQHAHVAGDHLMTILEKQQRHEQQLSARTSRRRSTSKRRTASRRTRHEVLRRPLQQLDASGLGPVERRLQRHRRGMEMAMEDCRQRPDAHSVSNSWGYGRLRRVGLAGPVS